MIKPLDRSKIHLNDFSKKDDKDIKVGTYLVYDFIYLKHLLIVCFTYITEIIS